MFESSVNPEGIQTPYIQGVREEEFESSVNPEGIQTVVTAFKYTVCLRVV